MAIPKTSSSIPIPKNPKVKTSKTSKPAKPSLSTEFVQDSDVSDEVTRKPSKNEPLAKSEQPASLITKPLKSINGPNLKPVKAKSIHKGTVRNKISESEDVSDENQSSSSSPDSTPTPVRRTSVSKLPTKTEPKKPLNGTKLIKRPEALISNESKPEAKSTTSEESSEENASASGENESESSSESESGKSVETSPERSERGNVGHNERSAQPSKKYNPPTGFEKTTISIHPTSKSSEMFLPQNLVGKQIWHITAPMSVPMTSIKQVSAQSLQNGASIVSHKGAEYDLSPEVRAGQESGHALLLPSTQNNDYRLSRNQITKTLHLQQLVNLPSRVQEISASQKSTASKPQAHVKAPHQQPEGLRMRYYPFGASQDFSSDSDVSVMARPKAPEFRNPKSAENELNAKKRRRSALDVGEQRSETSPVKKRKQKLVHEDRHLPEYTSHDVEGHVDEGIAVVPKSNGASQVTISGNIVSSEKPKRRKKAEKQQNQKDVTPENQSILPPDLSKEAETIIPQEVVELDGGVNNISPDGSPMEQKKRRKETKRKRKEGDLGTNSQDHSTKRDAKITHGHLGNHDRAQSTSVQRSERSSPSKVDARQESQIKHQMSSQSTPQKETKEDRAKRKEEKRKQKAKA